MSRRPICRPVEVDGETVMVRGTRAMTAAEQEAFAEVVRAAKAMMDSEPPEVKRARQERRDASRARLRAALDANPS